MTVADPFADLVVAENATIRDAMTALNNNGREVVFVRAADSRLGGLLTDGDIRRSLLAGATLDFPVTAATNRNFFSVDTGVDRATVLDLMRARGIQHVPVVDRDGRLLAIHFLRDLIGAAPKPNMAVVMAGGKGTRLRPTTDTIPKPMVTVAGRPILERIVLHLLSHGIREIFLAVNYRAEIIKEYFGNGEKFGCTIEYLHEDSPLGTGGPLSLLPQRPAEPFFVLNGDLVTTVDLTRMLEKHIESKHAATIGIGPYQVQIPFGVVTEKNGQMIALEEKPALTMLVSRGIYILNSTALDYVPKGEDYPITALLETMHRAGDHVGVFHCDDSWIDVGVPADLHRAHGLL